MDRSRESALGLVPTLASIEGQLEIYEQLLKRWQSKINLVGRSTVSDLWVRHFADSAQLAELASTGARWADLGSGAGFPGLVIALIQAGRNAGEMHLIESDVRKAAFLREVSRETGASAIVHNARCEDVLEEIGPGVLCSRAMTDMTGLLAYATPIVENGGQALFMKGRDIEAELTRASIPSNFRLELSPSKIDPASTIVRVKLAGL